MTDKNSDKLCDNQGIFDFSLENDGSKNLVVDHAKKEKDLNCQKQLFRNQEDEKIPSKRMFASSDSNELDSYRENVGLSISKKKKPNSLSSPKMSLGISDYNHQRPRPFGRSRIYRKPLRMRDKLIAANDLSLLPSVIDILNDDEFSQDDTEKLSSKKVELNHTINQNDEISIQKINIENNNPILSNEFFEEKTDQDKVLRFGLVSKHLERQKIGNLRKTIMHMKYREFLRSFNGVFKDVSVMGTLKWLTVAFFLGLINILAFCGNNYIWNDSESNYPSKLFHRPPLIISFCAYPLLFVLCLNYGNAAILKKSLSVSKLYIIIVVLISPIIALKESISCSSLRNKAYKTLNLLIYGPINSDDLKNFRDTWISTRDCGSNDIQCSGMMLLVFMIIQLVFYAYATGRFYVWPKLWTTWLRKFYLKRWYIDKVREVTFNCPIITNESLFDDDDESSQQSFLDQNFNSRSDGRYLYGVKVNSDCDSEISQKVENNKSFDPDESRELTRKNKFQQRLKESSGCFFELQGESFAYYLFRTIINKLLPKRLKLNEKSVVAWYVGEVDKNDLPHGFGCWKCNANHGEHLVGFWRRGTPTGPFRCREYGSGSGFMCIRVGWVKCMTENSMDYGTSDVECCVSGKFFRTFPRVKSWEIIPRKFDQIDEKNMNHSSIHSTRIVPVKSILKKYNTVEEKMSDLHNPIWESISEDYDQDSNSETEINQQRIQIPEIRMRQSTIKKIVDEASTLMTKAKKPVIDASNAAKNFLLKRVRVRYDDVDAVRSKLLSRAKLEMSCHIPNFSGFRVTELNITLNEDASVNIAGWHPKFTRSKDKMKRFNCTRRNCIAIHAVREDSENHNGQCIFGNTETNYDLHLDCDEPKSDTQESLTLNDQFVGVICEDARFPHLFVDNWECADIDGAAEAWIFCHGYNTNHGQSLQILGQMVSFGNFPNYIKPFLFAWPAGNNFLEFFRAKENSKNSAYHLLFMKFLVSIRNNGIRHVHFMAHSLGSRLLLMSIRKIVNEINLFQKVPNSKEHKELRYKSDESSKMKVITLTLLNPEFELNQFVNHEYPFLRKYCNHISLYCDSLDRALWWAETFSRERSLGRSVFGLKVSKNQKEGKSRSTIYESIASLVNFEKYESMEKDCFEWLDLDVIDTTWLGSNVHKLRHSYWSLNREIISDIRELIVCRKRARERVSFLDRRCGNVYVYRVAPSNLKSIFESDV